MSPKFFTLICVLVVVVSECRSEENIINKEEGGVRLKKEADLKTEASQRYLEIGYPGGTPAAVYGAPPSTGFYPSNGYSGYQGSSLTAPGYSYSNFLGNGYLGSGYSGYSGLGSGYSGYSGLGSGYSGYSGLGSGYNGYNSLGSGYNSYIGNGYGGYGGYGGNGGYSSYSGYSNGYNPYHQGNLGYGYYKGSGLGGIGGSTYYNRGLTGYAGVTPSYVSGYRGYNK